MPKYIYTIFDKIFYMNENDNHLPVYGVGPLLVAPLVIVSVIGLILSYYRMMPILQLDYLKWPLIILGILIIICGAYFWISAVKSNIQDKIKSNKLVTTGVYGLIRHPIYAAFLYLSTGLTLISCNIYLFFLPILS